MHSPQPSQSQTPGDEPREDLKRKQSKLHTRLPPAPTAGVRTLVLQIKHRSKDRGSECGSCALGPAESAVSGGNLTERYTLRPDVGGGGQRGTAQMEWHRDTAPGSDADQALDAQLQAYHTWRRMIARQLQAAWVQIPGLLFKL